MKKTLSFEKDLTFKTMIGEITTISLEDDLKFIDNSNIEGNFYVSGKYKMTEASSIVEDFSYNIPISVSMIQDLDLNTTKINITNFTYEIIDGSILRCKIDVLVEGIENINVPEKSEEEIERECDDDIVEEKLKELPVKEDLSKRENETYEKEQEEKNDKEKVNNNAIKVNSLFANLSDDSDTFTTYSVYIMRENDSIEKVMDKYKVSKEQIEDYNDLSKLELNSKVIIPTSTDENE